MKKILVLAGALALLAAQPSFAQDGARAPADPDHTNGGTTQPNGDRVLPGRIGGDRNDRRRERPQAERRGRAAQPSAEENKAAAQALVTSAGITCQVEQANRIGVTAEQQATYEATCATGPGYILVSSTPAQAYDCIELKGQADQVRARDPNADVGQQCAIPQNLDTLAVVKGYATAAGLTCTIDEASVVGKSMAGNVVYEVGCSNAPGYWLERQGAGWLPSDCLQVISTNGTCRFTTNEEQVAAFQPKLAGTDAADCSVQQVRLMGQNANGRFYEIKCAAEGQGYVARINQEGVTQQIYACATAQQLGGGCTLTPAPAAAPATGGRA